MQDLVAQFKEKLRAHDYIARLNALGMGEFAVILSEISDYFDAGMVAKRLLQIIRSPYKVNDTEIKLDASIGIACYPADNHSVMDFHKNAVLAMYYAKQNNGEIYYFNEEINAENKKRLDIESDLIRGFEQNEFVLYYQPIFNLHSMSIIGFQSLMQWNHPKYHIVNLAEFLPVAEKSNLIIDMTHWIISQAKADQQQWIKNKLNPELLFVRISAKHLQDKNALDDLIQLIDTMNLQETHLGLQLPEQLILENMERYQSLLRKWLEDGIHLSFTKVGKSATNFNFLKHRPVDTLIVDQHFIRNANAYIEDAAVAKTIISMANHMGMEAIAEGIQNQEQLHFLQDHRCHYGSGDFLCKPLSSDDVINSTNAESNNSLKLVNGKS